MSKTHNYTINHSQFTLVEGNQTTYNFGDPSHGAYHFNFMAENPDPQTSTQDPTSRDTRAEPSEASLVPTQSSTAYPQESQQSPVSSQNQQAHGFQWNASPSLPLSAPCPPLDLSRNPNPVQPPLTGEYGYPQLPTPALPPLVTPESNVANTPQSPPPNPPFSPLTPFNNSQATPMRTLGQNSRHRSRSLGSVPAQPKY